MEKDNFLIFQDSILANYSISNVFITGYTNEIGEYDYNYRLSTNRAHYIHQLIYDEKLKIPTEVVGKGEIVTIKEKNFNNQLIENRKAVIEYTVHIKADQTTSISEFEVGEKMTIKSIGFIQIRLCIYLSLNPPCIR